MSNHQDQIIEQLASQLSTIQEQLSQLTKRFDKLEGNLAEVSQLTNFFLGRLITCELEQ